jgi:hypothetical protein
VSALNLDFVLETVGEAGQIVWITADPEPARAGAARGAMRIAAAAPLSRGVRP